MKTQWLKDDSVWVVKTNQDTSWCWRQILGLRDKVRNFIYYKIGKGDKCFFWFDRWHERGSLCNIVNYTSLMLSSLDRKLKVAELICNDGWNWPLSWNERFSVVMDIQVPKLMDYVDDKIVD